MLANEKTALTMIVIIVIVVADVVIVVAVVVSFEVTKDLSLGRHIVPCSLVDIRFPASRVSGRIVLLKHIDLPCHPELRCRPVGLPTGIRTSAEAARR